MDARPDDHAVATPQGLLSYASLETEHFRNSWSKLARADEHYLEMWKLVKARRARHPSSFTKTMSGSSERERLLEIEWRFKLLEEIPAVAGLILGDFVGAVRAALDHMVWQLVHEFHGAPRNQNLVMFPICLNGQDWKGRPQEIRPLVDPRAWEVIRSAQPVHGTAPVSEHPLAWLKSLSNADKHRSLPIFSVGHLRPARLDVDERSGIQVIERFVSSEPLCDGGLVARIKALKPPGTTYVDMSFSAVESVRLLEETGQHVIKRLDVVMGEIRYFVHETIDRVACALDHEPSSAFSTQLPLWVTAAERVEGGA